MLGCDQVSRSTFQIFDSGSKWPSTDSSTGAQAIIRSRLRQLIAKFALRSELLPESLFLPNVTCEDKNSCHGGAFADISRGKYPNGEVALKRLRIFQVASMPDRSSLKKVRCLTLTAYQSVF